MKTSARLARRGFTLIEILVAMAIFAIVVAAIYSTWSGIIKSSKMCQEVTAQVQRERIAARTLEEALTCTHSFAADPQHYGFVFDNNGTPTLSFVARLPRSFPRSGKYGDFDMRRVTFTVENDTLVLRQRPILMDFDEDETEHPLELGRDVKSMEIEALDPITGSWTDTWLKTNLLPKMISVTVTFNPPKDSFSTSKTPDAFQRVVALPCVAVGPTWQIPGTRPR